MINELINELNRMNKRTSYEWDAFMRGNGQSWGELSEAGKRAACELAEKQGERDKVFMAKYKITYKT